MTYAESGVDIEKENEAIKAMIPGMAAIRKGFGKPLEIEGHYAGAIDFGEYALVLCTDGVGSKVEIANALKKWDTVGIDCMAMNVNDAICIGAEPLSFVDYLAIEDPDPEITRQIGEGLKEGARQSNVSIIGGETASLPGVIKGFDLAGTCLAYVKKDAIITGKDIAPGDVMIGLRSTGIHSNGYSLARRIFESHGFSYYDMFPSDAYTDKTLGEVLLTPTKIYVREILELISKVPVKGLAHITGSGLKKIKRLNNSVRYVFDSLFEPLPVFKTMQELGNVTDYEMYKTFNMGMGFVVVVAPENAERALAVLRGASEMECKVVGRIEQGTGSVVPQLGIEY
ncbi:MAG: phosphoribosylformylglycinamidine cyclo-ligase [Thermoplasmata archaeon HGW-Thermoplasmata-1]|nr:MAG: phosphoribosylformylglycinamidine cyclo-ligase [Thermoplasmata archaeon HGW-Thermoplasmata-1]